MKRFIRLTLVLTMAIGMAVMLGMVSYAQDPAAMAVGTAQVTASVVNVRTGPGTNYPIAGKMVQGTRVPVLDFSPVKGFVKVSFEGNVRYVTHTALHTVTTQPIQKTPTPNVDPTAVIDRVIITTNVLNVRLAPSKSSAVVGKVTKGTVVPVINYNAGSGYAQISYEGVVRYAYLKGYSTRVVANELEPTPVTGTARVTADRLHVRTGPGTNYGIVGMLTHNETVTVLNYNAGNGFAQISYHGAVYYASLSYLAH